MPQSLARVVLHVTFSTKNRAAFVKDIDLRQRLHAYMAGVLQKIGCEPILIGGVENHVHLLCNLSRTVTIAELIEEAKKAPSKWTKDQGPQYREFFWQSGYGAFSGQRIAGGEGACLYRRAGGTPSQGVVSG